MEACAEATSRRLGVNPEEMGNPAPPVTG
jgi:hypothetical protein